MTALGAMVVGLAPAGPASAALPTSLTTTADTTTNLASVNTNYGTATTIYGSPTNWKAFLRFPTAQIDDGAVLTGAKLRLFGQTTSTSRWEIHPASSAWSEASTTYSTMPSWNSTVLATSSATATAGSWNVVNLPVSAISTTADTNLGVMGTVTGKIGFQSREGANAPQLVLTYASSGSGGSGDTTPPDTSITSKPASSTTSTDASFAFTSTEPSTFTCAFDGAAFAPCTSPKAYTGLAVGSHTFSVRATDTAGNVDPTPASYTWQITSGSTTTTPQPHGPSGTWNLKFDDEFSGTSLDTSRWRSLEGATMNNVTAHDSNVSVSGGYLRLQLASSSSGAFISSSPADGAGVNGYLLPVGGVAEARIWFPGSSTEQWYNWPAWWVSGPNWPAAGEHDIAEGLGGDPTVNYHGTTNSANFGTVPGTWNDGFHTFTLYRKASSADVYWDGKLVDSYPTGDNGQPESLLLNVGASGSRAAVTGAAGQVKVDYVRAWQ